MHSRFVQHVLSLALILHFFRVLLLRRLRLPSPLSSRNCRCGRLTRSSWSPPCSLRWSRGLGKKSLCGGECSSENLSRATCKGPRRITGHWAASRGGRVERQGTSHEVGGSDGSRGRGGPFARGFETKRNPSAKDFIEQAKKRILVCQAEVSQAQEVFAKVPVTHRESSRSVSLSQGISNRNLYFEVQGFHFAERETGGQVGGEVQCREGCTRRRSRTVVPSGRGCSINGEDCGRGCGCCGHRRRVGPFACPSCKLQGSAVTERPRVR